MTYLTESIDKHELELMVFWHNFCTEEVACGSCSMITSPSNWLPSPIRLSCTVGPASARLTAWCSAKSKFMAPSEATFKVQYRRTIKHSLHCLCASSEFTESE